MTARHFSLAILCVALLIAGITLNWHSFAGRGVTEPAATLSFNDTIQPILSENCYGCHGPDSSNRKAGLRLDRREDALALHEKFRAAIIAGKPDRSPLIQRIEAKDPKERMPPLESHKTLKPEQIALLRQWVKEGAHYEPHWAFIAPKRPAVPRNEAADQWARTDIDRFIYERLQKDKLSPAAEADKRSLIRRVTYGLTGLPPTVEEVDAFLADQAPDAYEEVVDRLLASPRYGEHRAHYWLDYVRYGDTHGIHLDNYRAIWPYRDYVIAAYNRNQRFDSFVRDQLAGDLLRKQSLETLIATGYMRSNPTTNEGGTIPEEVFVNLTRDRVETFGVTFLGLTTGCAVCHDHKFDPTTQKDTYQLSAFLNNTVDGPMDFNSPDPPPVIRLPPKKNLAEYEKLLAERGELLARIADRRTEAAALMRSRLAAGQVPRGVSTEQLQMRLKFDENLGGNIKNSAPHAAIRAFKVEGVPLKWGEVEWLWPAARFDTNTQLSLKDVGDVESDEAFSVGGWVMIRKSLSLEGEVSDDKAVVARLGEPGGSDQAGWGLFFRMTDYPISGNGHFSGDIYLDLINDPWTKKPAKQVVSAAASKNEDKNKDKTPEQEMRERVAFVAGLKAFVPMKRAVQVKMSTHVFAEEWVHVFATYDGSRSAHGVRLYLNGKPTESQIMNDSLGTQPIRTKAATYLARTAADKANLREMRYQDMRFYRRALSAEEVVRLPFEDVAAEIVARQPDPARWTPQESFVALERYLLDEQDPSVRQWKAQVQAIQVKLDALAPESTPDKNFMLVGETATKFLQDLIENRQSSLIAQERDTPAYAHILKRGDYASRQERVEPATPHFLPPLPASTRKPDRLALANWLFSAENPLFARVAVNRMWQEMFGVGLVESSGDFGLTGARPSNQKLLDWLAVEFRESGWDVKRMYRLMVLSAAYRQSAHVTPQQQTVDPANRLLARAPRFRMDAEELRDSALAVSGLLVEKLGGAPVKPYQPAGLWEEVAMTDSNTRDYKQDSGENLYRRSIYTFLKRSSPPPSMETFDAPTRETACPRRARADTPLQALVTLNDPQFVEAARMLAQHALVVADSPDQRMDVLAHAVLTRTLDNTEKSVVERSRQTWSSRFRAEPRRAQSLLSIGVTPPKKGLDPVELATWTLVANQLMNLDEFLTK